MALPSLLRRLDERVLGPRTGTRRPLLRGLLSAVARVASLVLLGCALLLVAAVAAVVLPTDETNVLVKGVLDGALRVAGPFATVFDVESRAARAAANYGLAAVAYLVASRLVARLGR